MLAAAESLWAIGRWLILPVLVGLIEACAEEETHPATPPPTDQPPDRTVAPPECGLFLETDHQGVSFGAPFANNPQFPATPTDGCDFKVIERNRQGFMWDADIPTRAYATYQARFDSRPPLYQQDNYNDWCRANRVVCETSESYFQPRIGGGTLLEQCSQEPALNPTYGLCVGDVFETRGLTPDETALLGSLWVFEVQYDFTHLPKDETDPAVADIRLTVWTTSTDAVGQGRVAKKYYSGISPNSDCVDHQGIEGTLNGESALFSTFSQEIPVVAKGPIRFVFRNVQLRAGERLFTSEPADGCMLVLDDQGNIMKDADGNDQCLPIEGIAGIMIEGIRGILEIDCGSAESTGS